MCFQGNIREVYSYWPLIPKFEILYLSCDQISSWLCHTPTLKQSKTVFNWSSILCICINSSPHVQNIIQWYLLLTKTINIYSPKITFPGIKQQSPVSIYLIYVILSNERRVSIADRMSTCLANGWFLRSDSLRGSWLFTFFWIWECKRSTRVKPVFNKAWHLLLICWQTCNI